MAKQRYGINDGYRGTVGTVIGYMWRGRWCLRARPRSVRNPRTEKQQHNRELFKQMVFLASAFKQALRKGMHHQALAEHLTECNLFVKRNKECFALSQEGKLDVKWEQLIISEGELATVEFFSDECGVMSDERGVMSDERGVMCDEREVVVPFESVGGAGDDEVYLWAFCPEAGEGVLSMPATRHSKSVRITLPERWQGMAVHLYGFVTDYKGRASETVYIGALEPEEQPLSANSQTVVEKKRWHRSCNRNICSTFAKSNNRQLYLLYGSQLE